MRILGRLSPSPWEYPAFTINLVPFVVSFERGTLHLAEHQQALWLSKEELPGLDWAPADVPIVEELLQSEWL